MKLPRRKRDEKSAALTQTLLMMAVCSLSAILTAYASDPTAWNDPNWWTASGGPVLPQVVTTNNGVVTTNYPANYYMAANQGQLKLFTSRAASYLNATLTNNGGAGTTLSNVVYGWQQDYLTNGYSSTNIKPSDYKIINLGQLKYVAGLVYGQLASAGYTGLTPAWLQPNPNTDYMAANLGQLKTAFNFNLSVAPPSVTGLTVSSSNPDELDLSWTLPANNNAQSFTLLQSTDGGTTWTTVATLDPTDTSYSISGLDSGTSYSYLIEANNGADTSASAATTPTTPPPPIPQPPMDLVGTLDTNFNMILTWPSIVGATNYLVEREDLPTGTWCKLTNTPATTYEDTNYVISSYQGSVYVSGGHHYRVSSSNTTGSSPPSAEYPLSRYTLIDLGTNMTPNAINNNGDVVGTDANNNGVLWHAGTPAQLVAPSAPSGYANYQIVPSSINDSGAIVGTQVVGTTDDPSNVQYSDSAVYWSSGTASPSPLPHLSSYPNYSSASTISNLGNIAGLDTLTVPRIVGTLNLGSTPVVATYWNSYSSTPNFIYYPTPSIQKVFSYTLSGTSYSVDNTSGVYSLLYSNPSAMNRNGDTVTTLGETTTESATGAYGSPVFSTGVIYNLLIKQSDSSNTLLPFAWHVNSFTDTTPYIYVGYDGSSTTWLYDSGTGQTISLGAFNVPQAYSISSPSDPTKVQAIGMNGRDDAVNIIPGFIPAIFKKTVPPGSPNGTAPTWSGVPENLNDLLPTGWQVQSLVQINNSNSILGTAINTSGNTLHGMTLIHNEITRDGMPNTNNTVWVGQQINLTNVVSGVPSSAITSCHWSIPGVTFKDYEPQTTSPYTCNYTNLAPSDFNTNYINYFWSDGASNRVVTCTEVIYGQTNIISATFNVRRPNVKINVTKGTITVDTSYFASPQTPLGDPFLHFGNIPSDSGIPGMSFSQMNTNVGIAGTFCWSQILTNTTEVVTPLPGFTGSSSTVSGLDHTFPFNATQTNAYDAPGTDLTSTESGDTRSFNATMYYMWKPDSGSLNGDKTVYVPLRGVTWNWSGVATNTGTFAAPNWSLVPGSAIYPSNVNDYDVTNEPTWSSTVSE